jgi:hypothetical protein
MVLVHLACDILPLLFMSRMQNDQSTKDTTFCFRHATQAVILRVISGGFRSPNDSLRAITAGGEDSDTSSMIMRLDAGVIHPI